MATEFLNDARKEIEGRTADFYGALKAFYQGNGEAEQNLMEQTTQPFWQSLRLSRKRLQQRELTVDMEMQEPVQPADYDGPKKDGYDYTCHRTKAVKMRRTYYRKGKKDCVPKDTGDCSGKLFESGCAGGYGDLPQLWS